MDGPKRITSLASSPCASSFVSAPRRKGGCVASRLIATAFLVPLLALPTMAADRAAESSPPPDQHVAWVGDVPVTSSDLEAYLSIRAFSPAPGQEEAMVRKRLEELLRAEMLSREAVILGIDRLPDVRMAIRELLARRLIEEKVHKPLLARPIGETELRAFYQSNLPEFSRPEQARLAGIFVAAPADGAPAARSAAAKQAADILEEALALKDTRFGFSELILKHSATHILFPRGDTGFFDREGRPAGLPVPLVEAAFSLPSNGVVLDRVVETPEGFHVVMRTAGRSAEHHPFEEVREAIEARLRREEIRRAEEEYLRALERASPFRIEEEVLKAFVGKVTGPAPGTAAGPPPLPKASP